jgi:hypothetical protein
MKRTWPILLVLLLLAAAPSQAQPFLIMYSTNGSTITLTRCSGLAGPVTVSNFVTCIGAYAFQSCSRVTSVTIPDSVGSIGTYAFNECEKMTNVSMGNGLTNIGDGAFYACFSLAGITIPNSVTSIGCGAFADCPSLTAVTIPAAVTSISSNAFGGCSDLTAINVDSNNSAYESVGGVLFNQGQTSLIQFPAGNPASSYAVPNSVTNIAIGAFDDCGNLASVTLPNSVTTIQDDAFSGCVSLTNIAIPNSVTSIGNYAFVDSTNLVSATIGNNVTNLGYGAFYVCPSLTAVCFLGNAPATNTMVFVADTNAVAYYLPGTDGWDATFDAIPTAPWTLPNPVILNNTANFGLQPAGFGFTISWATNTSVVVEACTDLTNPVWIPVQTNTLTNGSCYFSDPQWTNFPGRYYRINSL